MDATLLPLTAPNRRPHLASARRSFNDVKGKSEATLDLIEGAKGNINRVLRERNGQQNRSQASRLG
jgi:hypothetical protein